MENKERKLVKNNVHYKKETEPGSLRLLPWLLILLAVVIVEWTGFLFEVGYWVGVHVGCHVFSFR